MHMYMYGIIKFLIICVTMFMHENLIFHTPVISHSLIFHNTAVVPVVINFLDKHANGTHNVSLFSIKNRFY